MRKTFTYTEFVAAPEHRKARLCRVSFSYQGKCGAMFLEYEPGNGKWYAPVYLEMRHEVGYAGHLWKFPLLDTLPGQGAKIDRIEILISYN